MTIDEFKKEVARTMLLWPSYRYGQAVFNVMYELFPEKANAFRATAVDPFYQDEKAEEFIRRCFPNG